MAETDPIYTAKEAISAGAGAASERGSAMNLNDLKSQVALGEDSRQFKRDLTNVDSRAAEMAAFINWAKSWLQNRLSIVASNCHAA